MQIDKIAKVIGSTASKSSWRERLGIASTPLPSEEKLREDAARRTAAKEAALEALQNKRPPKPSGPAQHAMDEARRIEERLNREYFAPRVQAPNQVQQEGKQSPEREVQQAQR